uniref:FH2 domain-containing protein n=1 Tax=Ditylenchus dipsaci TaxID=166011 RepID=A0A915D252_9BILA
MSSIAGIRWSKKGAKKTAKARSVREPCFQIEGQFEVRQFDAKWLEAESEVNFLSNEQVIMLGKLTHGFFLCLRKHFPDASVTPKCHLLCSHVEEFVYEHRQVSEDKLYDQDDHVNHNQLIEVKSSSCLQRILFVLLHMGNYLNYGAVLGNAVGFKLNSLWKINDKELAHIQDAAKLSFETLQSDLNGLQQRIQNLEKSSSKITHKDAFFQQFDSFSRSSKSRLSTATSLLKQIEEQRRELAIYFCENEKTFSMEECFKIFHAFVNRFKVASHENNQRAEFSARKSEEVKQQATGKTSNPLKEDSLSKLLLSSDPYTPTSKRPRLVTFIKIF